MDVFHSLLYKHKFTTTAETGHVRSAEKTFVFYDGFCVPKEARGSVSNDHEFIDCVTL